MSSTPSSEPSLRLRKELTCIHCWAKFAPEQLVWVSEHRDLIGDPMLGESQQRFLPTRFTVEGNALDARGLPCHTIACPHCHLPLPRPLLDSEPLFVSIFGSPSCGKSFYLASLAYHLRNLLPNSFGLSFTDADAKENANLIRYEESLFLNDNSENPVPLSNLIPKTQLQGDLYHSVRQGRLTVSYPCPFSFLIEPAVSHPYSDNGAVSRVLCLYDNAGEHFLPGNDSATAPGTRHLATSSLLLFLYDPTQDRRLDEVLRRAAGDDTVFKTRHSGRQESVLREAAARVHRYLNIPRGVRHTKPLIVVVTKADVWSALLPDIKFADPWLRSSRLPVAAIDRPEIENWSAVTRSFLINHVPEIVQAAEEFTERVYYLPVSALGTAPSLDDQGQPWIRPAEIRPTLVDVPMVFGLSLATRHLFVHAAKRHAAR